MVVPFFLEADKTDIEGSVTGVERADLLFVVGDT
jgi:hypothetical protein